MSLGRICVRVLYDSNTHVLTVVLIQSNRILVDEKLLKLYPKILFYITVKNQEKCPRYKSSTKPYSDIITFNESFYFPNINESKLRFILISKNLTWIIERLIKYYPDEFSNQSILISLHGKEKFGNDKLISQSSYALNNLKLINQFNYLTLYLEVKIIQNILKSFLSLGLKKFSQN
jgi:hypothetical protein